MERPNARGANNFVIGLFVTCALLVGAGFVVFMGGSTSIGGEVKIKTFFTDVRGLNVGAPVYYSGIQVGRVSEFVFPTPEESAKIGEPFGLVTILSIYKEHRPRIKADSDATITTQGVLGDKVVVISQGTPASASLDDSMLLLSKTQKELGDYLEKGGDVVENLNRVAKGLDTLIQQMNDQQRIEVILKNLEKTTANLAASTQALSGSKGPLGSLINGGPSDDLGPALKSLRSLLAKVDRGEGTLGALINDPSLHEDLRVLLGGAKRSQVVRFLIRQAIQAQDEKANGAAAPGKK